MTQRYPARLEDRAPPPAEASWPEAPLAARECLSKKHAMPAEAIAALLDPQCWTATTLDPDRGGAARRSPRR